MLFEILGAGRPAAGTRDDKAKFRRGDHGERILHDIGKAGLAAGAAGCCDGRARLPWHPAGGRVESSRLGVPSARPSSVELALPAEDGRLWSGGKRAGWNRGHDLATGAALNRAARDGETRRRLAAGESVRAVARALRCAAARLPCSGRGWR